MFARWAQTLAVLLLTVATQPHAATSRTYNASRRRAAAGNEGTCVRRMHTDPVPGYTWFSTEAVRQRAQVHQGSQARLRAALDRYTKLKEGERLKLVFLGGSITAGQGAVDGHPFPEWAELALKGAMGPSVLVHNGAVPGTLSSYMSVCHNMHVPKDADIIFLDYSINDDSNIMPLMDNGIRRPFERLIRKLLNYPRRPAVLMVHSFMWHRLPQMGPPGLYYPSSERDFHEFGTYYGLPEISVKAGAWKLMKKGLPGFQVHRTRADHSGFYQAELDKELKGNVFYWDIIHPDGSTGHRFMGEIVVQALLDAMAGLRARPFSADDQEEVDEELPPPMLQNNWESTSDRCFIGTNFLNSVVESTDWEYKDEGKDPARPKLGYISTKPGSVLKLKVNTTSPTGNADVPVVVEVAHLKSYINMGQANVTCIQGCLCTPTLIEGHHTDKTSQLFLHEFPVTQADECVIAIEVLASSSSAPGHNKVKIAGITISEEGGAGGIKNYGAVQMVAEGSHKDQTGTGTFEIRQWAVDPAAAVIKVKP